MTEKEIKLEFVDHLKEFAKIMNIKHNLRLYAMELPLYTVDGTKFADMVIEIEEDKNHMLNQLIVMEWKKGFIETGAIEQCERYAITVQNQLRRKQNVIRMIASAEGFSDFELKMCRIHDFYALKYDPKTHYMELEK